MNLGITSASIFNLYASALLAALLQRDESPACVICLDSSGWLNKLKKYGYTRRSLRNLYRRFNSTSRIQKDARFYLSEFASKHTLSGWDLPLSDLCKRHNVPFLSTESLNSKKVVDWVRQQNIDILINAGGGIFSQPLIDAPNMGLWNAHMGYLPTFRGVNVLEWSLFHQHRIGVTLHTIDRGIDTGDTVLFREIPVEEDDTIDTLRAKSLVTNLEIISEGLDLLNRDQLPRNRQQPDMGKQYFVMHPRMKNSVENRLRKRYSE